MAENSQQPQAGLLIDFPHGTGGGTPHSPAVSFSRQEFSSILNVYGRKVVQGEWRDYAMDFLKDRALFSIYRRSSERPLYVIEKIPRLRNRQGQYQVTSEDGRVLKRGHELDIVLRIFELRLVR